jgi:hypothetical protein
MSHFDRSQGGGMKENRLSDETRNLEKKAPLTTLRNQVLLL